MKARVVELTLLTKPGCHLCDDARLVVAQATAEVAATGLQVAVTELDITTDESLANKYSEDIPVVLVDGKRHSFWHVDKAKLTAEITKRAKPKIADIFLRGGSK